jgi:drug/metabolite transporter (DMT)-like permease
MPASDHDSVLRGGSVMALAMLAFITNDTLVKFIGKGVPLGEILLVRGVFAALVIGLIAWFNGGFRHLRRALTPAVAVRTLADVATTFLFLNALLHMPIANVTAIVQAVPFTIVVLSALFLGERVGVRRISAVIAGFLGVLLVVKPASSDFNAYALYALAAMFSVALRDIVTRRIPSDVPAVLVAFSNASAIAAFGAFYAAFEGLEPLEPFEAGVLMACALLLAAAYTFMVLAVRLADVSLTAPFRYTIILWSLLAGFLVFGDVPDPLAFLGIALIAGSGLYTLVRERQLRRRSAQSSPR